MKRTTTRGFTTQELLPILAIICIIAGLLLPLLAYAKKKHLQHKAEKAAMTNQVRATNR